MNEAHLGFGLIGQGFLLLFGFFFGAVVGFVGGFFVAKRFTVGGVIADLAHPSLLWLKDIWDGIANEEISPSAGEQMALDVVKKTTAQAIADVTSEVKK